MHTQTPVHVHTNIRCTDSFARPARVERMKANEEPGAPKSCGKLKGLGFKALEQDNLWVPF